MPPAPEEVKGAFGSDRLPVVEAYARKLATDGVVRGLIGPREVPRLWSRHVLNCAALGGLLADDRHVCDVGSGAGLPGLVLAIQRPSMKVTLVEPLLRRTTFLQEVVDELGLENVEVVRGRADALHGRRSFDVVTSRAVAPLDRLLIWCMPLVAPGAELLALKGSSVRDEIEEARQVLEKFGCAEPDVIPLVQDAEGVPTYALRVTRKDPQALPLSFGPGGNPRSRAGKGRRKAKSTRRRRSGGSGPG